MVSVVINDSGVVSVDGARLGVVSSKFGVAIAEWGADGFVMRESEERAVLAMLESYGIMGDVEISHSHG